jgi:hypothetical protein
LELRLGHIPHRVCHNCDLRRFVGRRGHSPERRSSVHLQHDLLAFGVLLYGDGHLRHQLDHAPVHPSAAPDRYRVRPVRRAPPPRDALRGEQKSSVGEVPHGFGILRAHSLPG